MAEEDRDEGIEKLWAEMKRSPEEREDFRKSVDMVFGPPAPGSEISIENREQSAQYVTDLYRRHASGPTYYWGPGVPLWRRWWQRLTFWRY